MQHRQLMLSLALALIVTTVGYDRQVYANQCNVELCSVDQRLEGSGDRKGDV